MHTAKCFKYLFYFLEILLMYFLQTTPNLMPEIFGVQPVLIICSAVTISLLEDESSTLFIALFAGVMVDITFTQSFGLFAILLPILCSLMKVTVKNKIKITLFSGFRISFVCIAIAVILQWFFHYCLQGYSAIFIILVNYYLPIFIYTILCMPILYLINFGFHIGMRSIEL